MEAMANGLPCVASRIRGNTDLIEGTNCGYLCDCIEDYAMAINNIVNSDDREAMRKACLERIKQFAIATTVKSMVDIYTRELG